MPNWPLMSSIQNEHVSTVSWNEINQSSIDEYLRFLPCGTFAIGQLINSQIFSNSNVLLSSITIYFYFIYWLNKSQCHLKINTRALHSTKKSLKRDPRGIEKLCASLNRMQFRTIYLERHVQYSWIKPTQKHRSIPRANNLGEILVHISNDLFNVDRQVLFELARPASVQQGFPGRRRPRARSFPWKQGQQS